MAKNGKMQKVVTQVLAVMLVASFVLAVVGVVWPGPVSAEYHKACWDLNCSHIGCEGHWPCQYFDWTIYQGGGYHCGGPCIKNCVYDPQACP